MRPGTDFGTISRRFDRLFHDKYYERKRGKVSKEQRLVEIKLALISMDKQNTTYKRVTYVLELLDIFEIEHHSVKMLSIGQLEQLTQSKPAGFTPTTLRLAIDQDWSIMAPFFMARGAIDTFAKKLVSALKRNRSEAIRVIMTTTKMKNDDLALCLSANIDAKAKLMKKLATEQDCDNVIEQLKDDPRFWPWIKAYKFGGGIGGYEDKKSLRTSTWMLERFTSDMKKTNQQTDPNANDLLGDGGTTSDNGDTQYYDGRSVDMDDAHMGERETNVKRQDIIAIPKAGEVKVEYIPKDKAEISYTGSFDEEDSISVDSVGKNVITQKNKRQGSSVERCQSKKESSDSSYLRGAKKRAAKLANRKYDDLTCADKRQSETEEDPIFKNTRARKRAGGDVQPKTLTLSPQSSKKCKGAPKKEPSKQEPAKNVEYRALGSVCESAKKTYPKSFNPSVCTSSASNTKIESTPKFRVGNVRVSPIIEIIGVILDVNVEITKPNSTEKKQMKLEIECPNYTPTNIRVDGKWKKIV